MLGGGEVGGREKGVITHVGISGASGKAVEGDRAAGAGCRVERTAG